MLNLGKYASLSVLSLLVYHFAPIAYIYLLHAPDYIGMMLTLGLGSLSRELLHLELFIFIYVRKLM